MKILLIADDVGLKKKISDYFKPKGYSIIHYTNPLKGMNNFEETEPEIVIFNSTDFPRHWKIANNFLKNDVKDINPVFFLLINEYFPMEEVCKAVYLGIDALISDDYENENYLHHLDDLIGRFYSSQITIKTPLLLENPEQRIDFMFMNPENFQLATGSLSELSLNGAGFKPDDRKSVFPLKVGNILEGCSLRTSEGIITIKAEIVNNSGIMDLRFISFSDNGKELLENYINNKE
ncbi:MAG: hypothetical protein PF518_16345 [Spirochaetaceae bacterium]|jgi:hypothetical protein|nr:hypothetical protein [Spirochaetaceae bacterium]